MAALTLDGVGKSFGATPAVDQVSLSLEPGERVAILGPSGCGKTTLLRLIAGFEQLDRGTIRLGDRRLAGPGCHLAPERRGIAMVFQHHALWPHMSVARNVAYPLKVRGIATPERARRVAEALAAVGLEGFAERAPAALSGGQRQRVALARCLVMTPPLVLLDEPLSSLDPTLRQSLGEAIRDFHRATGAAMLYITHDRGEAMALADRIAVMAAGRFLQVAPPRLIYREPGSTAVAQMVGEGGTVVARMMARPADGRAPISLLGYAATVRAAPDRAPGAVTLVLRPEDLHLAERGETGFAAILTRTLYQGGRLDLEIAPVGQEGSRLWLSLPASAAEPAPGAELKVAIADGWVLPAPAP